MMIQSLEVLRPVDFPYRLVSFKFFFENIGSHILNMYHAAGMHFIYEQKQTCYLYPQHELYQLLKLQNTGEPHGKKYEWLLMKAVFGGEPVLKADLEIGNEEQFRVLQPGHRLFAQQLFLHRLPEKGDDIVVTDAGNPFLFHHFYCDKTTAGSGTDPARIAVFYLKSCTDFFTIINLWLDGSNKLLPLP